MHNATAIITGSANQRPNTPCIRLWIDVTFRGLEHSYSVCNREHPMLVMNIKSNQDPEWHSPVYMYHMKMVSMHPFVNYPVSPYYSAVHTHSVISDLLTARQVIDR